MASIAKWFVCHVHIMSYSSGREFDSNCASYYFTSPVINLAIHDLHALDIVFSYRSSCSNYYNANTCLSYIGLYSLILPGELILLLVKKWSRLQSSMTIWAKSLFQAKNEAFGLGLFANII